MPLNRRLSYAQGYLELGMLQEAAAELDQIPAPACDSSQVLALRLALLQEQKNWNALRLAAENFVRREPQEAGGWITWAYATRRDQSLTAAEKILLEAELVHPDEATIHFNLGCYACQRGDLKEARRRVNRAVALEKSFRALAATDPDLAPLREAERADCPP
jgi:tetratricopeptide (TPR) repeat protein